MVNTPEIEEFDCPNCGGKIVRPIGASTLHSCDKMIPATVSK